ncbi:hypothetical protein ACQ9BO_08800 [Flavobacterium sp. P21]|uniref:hypothetical protein n=1 Tax=Flavobacterium sp. P21 TaxID=3423948 RepID=UPI003D666219
MNTPQLIFSPSESNLVGIEHGVKLEQLLLERNIKCIPIFLDDKNEDTITINGLVLTILSPRQNVVEELLKKWTADKIYQQYQSQIKSADPKITAEGQNLKSIQSILENPPFPHKWEDDLLNSSSIAFLSHYKQISLFFLGDANPELICREMERIGYRYDNRLELDLFKISHHGSKHNTTKELLEMVECSNYLISTDSSDPYYHPSRETLIMISNFGRHSPETALTIYSNYPLRLKRLFTDDELLTINIRFKPVKELTFPLI